MKTESAIREGYASMARVGKWFRVLKLPSAQAPLDRNALADLCCKYDFQC